MHLPKKPICKHYKNEYNHETWNELVFSSTWHLLFCLFRCDIGGRTCMCLVMDLFFFSWYEKLLLLKVLINILCEQTQCNTIKNWQRHNYTCNTAAIVKSIFFVCQNRRTSKKINYCSGLKLPRKHLLCKIQSLSQNLVFNLVAFIDTK